MTHAPQSVIAGARHSFLVYRGLVGLPKMSSATNFTPFMKNGADTFSGRVKMHYQLIDVVTTLVLDQLDKTSPTGETFVIGDYGTADGGTSFGLMTEAVALLRSKHGDDLPVQIVYEDQPINDFKPIFQRSQDLIRQFPNVFVLASGSSFYTQCLPPNSLNFVFCFVAVHWLSKRPIVTSPGLFPTFLSGAANEAYRKQAEEDWENFLLLRGTELKTGGCVIVTAICHSFIDDRLVELTVEDNYSSVLTKICRGMVEDGEITQKEFGNMHIPMYFRSREELEKPFVNKKSRVSMSGLRLVSMVTDVVTCPFRQRWECLQKDGNDTSGCIDAREHARSLVEQRRAWQEGHLIAGLDGHRTVQDKEEIINTIYGKYFDLIVKDPVKHSQDLIQVCLVIRKKENIASVANIVNDQQG